MPRTVVIYHASADPAAFEARYRSQHVPLAKKLPGLKRFEISRGPVMTPAGPSEFGLVATLYFDDMDAMQSAFASPEGQIAGADAQSFGVAHLLFFDDESV